MKSGIYINSAVSATTIIMLVTEGLDKPGRTAAAATRKFEIILKRHHKISKALLR